MPKTMLQVIEDEEKIAAFVDGYRVFLATQDPDGRWRLDQLDPAGYLLRRWEHGDKRNLVKQMMLELGLYITGLPAFERG